MKLNKILSIIAVAASLATGFAAQGQNGTMTPYSRYGYGMLRDNATSAQRAMGGTGYAMQSGRQINAMNPASYSAIDSLTFLFDMGIDLTAVWSSDRVGTTKNSGNDFGAGLDYITMQFPISKIIGASIGIVPYSSVGYGFGTNIENGMATRSGSGSINELYGGLAIEPFKGFSLGANIAYLFGTIYNDTYAQTETGSTALYERRIDVRDWHLDLGVQYGFNLPSRSRVTLGAVYSPAKTLLGHTDVYRYVADLDASPEPIESSKLKGLYTLPSTWGGGMNYQWAGRLMLEADFTYQPWSTAKYQGIDGDNVNLDNRWKVALGGQWCTNPRGSYVQRMVARAGAYYTHDYLNIRGNNVREYGVSVGLGLPITGFKTMVNLGVEWKHRQASPQTLVSEDYCNITIGVNFNEMWFRKAKIY